MIVLSLLLASLSARPGAARLHELRNRLGGGPAGPGRVDLGRAWEAAWTRRVAQAKRHGWQDPVPGIHPLGGWWGPREEAMQWIQALVQALGEDPYPEHGEAGRRHPWMSGAETDPAHAIPRGTTHPQGRHVPWLLAVLGTRPGDLYDALWAWTRDARTIVDWAESTAADPSSLAWDEALARASAWHHALAEAAFQAGRQAGGAADSRAGGEAGGRGGGTLVHRWADGWTLVHLATPADLDAEGTAMGHCVGGYAPRVREGLSTIHSLRDPRDRSQVTFETTISHLAQAQGRGNTLPLGTTGRAAVRAARVLAPASYAEWGEAVLPLLSEAELVLASRMGAGEATMDLDVALADRVQAAWAGIPGIVPVFKTRDRGWGMDAGRVETWGGIEVRHPGAYVARFLVTGVKGRWPGDTMSLVLRTRIEHLDPWNQGTTWFRLATLPVSSLAPAGGPGAVAFAPGGVPRTVTFARVLARALSPVARALQAHPPADPREVQRALLAAARTACGAHEARALAAHRQAADALETALLAAFPGDMPVTPAEMGRLLGEDPGTPVG